MYTKKILTEYNKNVQIYKNFKDKIQILLKELLLDKVNYHHITARVKKNDSLTKKLTYKKNKYSDINEITDIVGCRIISYFEDDVDEIVKILKKEFIIDEVNSINRKDMLESDKFGYLSNHIICSINEERLKLVEYKRYKDLKFEIQIRSVLQHAWAEIEHDIGYKSRSEIPKHIRRKFSRIAGLLETADENFCDIKSEIVEYQEKIQDKDELLLTELDLDSLYSYTKDNPLVLSIDKAIADTSNSELRVDEPTKNELSNPLKKLQYFHINNIQELDKLLKENEKIISKFSASFLKHQTDEEQKTSFNRGISYFYLAYLLSVKEENIQTIKTYIHNNIYVVDEDNQKNNTDELAQELLTAFLSIS